MSMKNGVKNRVNAALDTKDDLAIMLIEGGLDPRAALTASTILTKDAVSKKLDENFNNYNAAHITHSLKQQANKNLLN